MLQQVVKRNGKRFVLVEEAELKKLRRLAAKAATREAEALPEYPAADAEGNRPAVEYARVSIARKIIRDRAAAGLTQQELARRAGVRQETISRLESGKHSPTVRTVDKIDRVLQAVLRKNRETNKKG
ncbi:MAG: helix-turn-helix transcriptional regulator [Planctomycetota bacterium]|nr:helix-turn-helix transcriptional regulator [Planctomycetota bacterium]